MTKTTFGTLIAASQSHSKTWGPSAKVVGGFEVSDGPPELIFLFKGGGIENDVFASYFNLRVLELLYYFPVVTLWDEHLTYLAYLLASQI